MCWSHPRKGNNMTGFKSKKAAALDEDGMYFVHHTAQELTLQDQLKKPMRSGTTKRTTDTHNGYV